MSDTPSRSARTWADVVAIVAGLVALGNAMWGPIIFTTMFGRLNQGDPGVGYNWLAFGIGGLLAILAVILAQKWPRPARIPLALGGVLLLAVPFAYRNWAPLPIVTSVVLGLAMLAATPFLGRMPAPRRAA
jgi:hypothetical protein